MFGLMNGVLLVERKYVAVVGNSGCCCCRRCRRVQLGHFDMGGRGRGFVPGCHFFMVEQQGRFIVCDRALDSVDIRLIKMNFNGGWREDPYSAVHPIGAAQYEGERRWIAIDGIFVVGVLCEGS